MFVCARCVLDVVWGVLPCLSEVLCLSRPALAHCFFVVSWLAYPLSCLDPAAAPDGWEARLAHVVEESAKKLSLETTFSVWRAKEARLVLAKLQTATATVVRTVTLVFGAGGHGSRSGPCCSHSARPRRCRAS